MKMLNLPRPLAVALFLVVVVAALAQTYTYTITNKSRYDLKAIYFSPASQTNWGRNRLTSRLATGETFAIRLDPGSYDVKFVDEDDDACILKNRKIEANGAWTLTTDWLLNCEDRSDQ